MMVLHERDRVDERTKVPANEDLRLHSATVVATTMCRRSSLGEEAWRHGMNSIVEETPPDRSVAHHRRLSVNITPAERVGRIVLGSAAIVAALIFMAGGGSVLAVALEVLLAAAGADLVITGAVGHCPLYQKLGHVPRSMRS